MLSCSQDRRCRERWSTRRETSGRGASRLRCGRQRNHPRGYLGNRASSHPRALPHGKPCACPGGKLPFVRSTGHAECLRWIPYMTYSISARCRCPVRSLPKRQSAMPTVGSGPHFFYGIASSFSPATPPHAPASQVIRPTTQVCADVHRNREKANHL